LPSLVAPVVGSDDTPLAVDAAAVGLDCVHLAARHVEVLDLRVPVEGGRRLLHVPLERADAVDAAVRRRVVAAEYLRLVDHREVVGDLLGREQLWLR